MRNAPLDERVRAVLWRSLFGLAHVLSLRPYGTDSGDDWPDDCHAGEFDDCRACDALADLWGAP